MHPADPQRDRDEADDRREACQPDPDGTRRRGQEGGSSAAEPGEAGHARPRDRPAQRAPRILSRQGAERLQSLVRDRARTSAKSHEEARDAEEPREERKKDRIRVDEGWPSEDRETEASRERLDPNRASEPTDAAPTAPLGCEDRS